MADSVKPTILQIDGYTMRLFCISDLDTLAAIWADVEVTRFLPSHDMPIPKADVENLVSFIDHWKVQGYGIWAIERDTSSAIAGYCGLCYLNELDEVELLYGLAKSYWGRGITTQAAKASISYGFDVAALDKIIAMVLPENQASRRVIEKAGLDYEKTVHMFDLDVLYYSLSRNAA
ncbi:putative acetyltransferase [Chondrocystis sp. NIES-4102]|nr:putative acetyltransferase [Chondrocystis sp. NIES-4102]